jgi:hypothetical protein
MRTKLSPDSSQDSFNLPKPLNLGAPLIENFDNVAEILELMERDPNHQ